MGAAVGRGEGSRLTVMELVTAWLLGPVAESAHGLEWLVLERDMDAEIEFRHSLPRCRPFASHCVHGLTAFFFMSLVSRHAASSRCVATMSAGCLSRSLGARSLQSKGGMQVGETVGLFETGIYACLCRTYC